MASTDQKGPSKKIVKPRTKAGKRILEKRAPKIIEEPRRALFLYGNQTSQVIKDVITDLTKLKATEALKFTRKNHEIRPFEAGGEAQLELHASRQDCSLFALGSHSKKRPNNLVLGRFYDYRLYDAIEFGVTTYRPVREFSAATLAQLGNKPAFIFVGDLFETDSRLRQAKSMILDFFRGRQIERINLKGLDRVIYVTHLPVQASTGEKRTVLFRQYAVKYKKSGTKVPRVEMEEMGPKLDLDIRRTREAAVDLEKEATKQPKVAPKKQKNVSADALDGRVGRIYMPKQDVEKMALNKMKGVKRERREAKAEAQDSKKKGEDLRKVKRKKMLED